jgi:hypothetical protein
MSISSWEVNNAYPRALASEIPAGFAVKDITWAGALARACRDVHEF